MSPTDPGWIVAWTADGSDEKQRYKIKTATAKDWSSNATVGGAFSGELGSLPTDFKSTTQSFTGDQTFPNSVAAVWLTVGAHWENNDGSGALDQGTSTEGERGQGTAAQLWNQLTRTASPSRVRPHRSP